MVILDQLIRGAEAQSIGFFAYFSKQGFPITTSRRSNRDVIVRTMGPGALAANAAPPMFQALRPHSGGSLGAWRRVR
jgi:hypothetical protein